MRDKINSSRIDLVYITSINIVADSLTKPLTGS